MRHASCCAARCVVLGAAAVCWGPSACGQAPAGITGDWAGNRTYLAENGVTFALDNAHFYQGVASGGLEQHFKYGGHGDYVANVDFGKLGVQEGLFLKVRAEHRWGENINSDTGSFLPAAVLADLPIRGGEELLLTNVLFTQALSENFAVFAGKLDTLDGDANAFAHGRGKSQFMNTGFVANPIALRTIPYSTLGCGFAVLGDNFEPLFTYTLLNSTDTANTSGFSELFNDGAAMSAELRLPTAFFGLPGHQLFGGTWSSREFVSLGQDPRVVFPDVPIARSNGSWSTYWNFDQYLVVDPSDATRGWGVFGRAGLGDEESNPLSWFLSFGVGGNNPSSGHETDTFGVGWFVTGSSDQIGPILETVLGPIEDGHGVELYYNWQATPWLTVTPDLQVLDPARENVDTAVVVGVRGVMLY